MYSPLELEDGGADVPVSSTDCGVGAETAVNGTTMKLVLLYLTVQL
jgi:hypothetical protein